MPRKDCRVDNVTHDCYYCSEAKTCPILKQCEEEAKDDVCSEGQHLFNNQSERGV